ncbi:uncharacterized protein BXZ73DRAFT_95480 [Epithele typhae]|uniref:uncharacterized protein n=1 Tax=Epithele typhae TaxID=378194 RepID=UPI0020077A81|nr:uncharacterized protein BXZ73DRAFT_95480 [Epithele typhae]KAH9945963.1 hypothetical protein BXZ73DRAFT_95480 [Epithele typhae]
MKHTRPLDDHPELVLIEASAWREYRVHTKASQRLSVGHFWFDGVVGLALAYFWSWAIASKLKVAVTTASLLAYVHSRLTQVIWESVVIFPSLGIQLETHRGLGGFSLTASRTFIPWSALEDFLINEGIRGWDIRYYLVAITRTSQGPVRLEVAFENILPRFRILHEIYHGVQDALRTESERASDTEN